MATSSARLNLTLPEPNDDMSLGNNVLRDNYAAIDKAVGVEINAAEPATFFEGKLWNDGTKTFLHTGTWEQIGDTETQRGFEGYDLDSVKRETTGQIEIMSVTFFANSNRKYLIETSIFLKFLQPGEGLIRLEWFADHTPGALKWMTFNWNSGEDDAHQLGTDVVASFEYVETVDRFVTIRLEVDASEAGGSTVIINELGTQTSMMITDWGKV